MNLFYFTELNLFMKFFTVFQYLETQDLNLVIVQFLKIVYFRLFKLFQTSNYVIINKFHAVFEGGYLCINFFLLYLSLKSLLVSDM